MGAPIGNTNGAKAKIWSAAITRALDKRTKLEGKEAIDELAEKLLKLCDQDNLLALREFGDRVEGKVAQSLTVGNEEGKSFKISAVELLPLASDD